MLLISCMALGGLCLGNYFRFRDPLYPAFLQSALWFFILAAFFAFQAMFYPITTSFALTVVAGCVIFTAGCYTATFRFKPEKRKGALPRMGRAAWILDVMLALSAIGFPFYLKVALELGRSGPFDDIFVNLRFAVTHDIYSFGISAYFGTLAIACLGFMLTLHREVPLWKLTLCAGLCLGYAVFSSGRTLLFSLVLMVLGILAMQRRIKPVHAVLMFVAVALVAFVLVAIATLKGGNIEASVEENAITLGESFLAYLLSPLPAMSDLYEFPPPPGFGENTFRLFYAIAERIGGFAVAPPLIQEYVFVPMPTNVYTVFQPYFVDFRWPGIVVAMFILGALHGHVYLKASQGNPYFVFVYGALTYPLFMQFFQDQYANLLSTWLQLILMIMIVREARSTAESRGVL